LDIFCGVAFFMADTVCSYTYCISTFRTHLQFILS
jgi:hypothetical protein